MRYNLQNTKESYIAAWNAMEIHSSRLPTAQNIAGKIIGFKSRYLPIEQVTGVPWYFIGLLHMRESNFNFDTHLHNGDPLSRRTKHVPANRPIKPPVNGVKYTFEESAIDALTYEFGTVKQWDIAQIAFLMETYNGFGYRNKGLPSPYLWSGSNQYVRGKYISDGIFDPTHVDVQLGVMVVLKCVLDADVVLKSEDMITNDVLPIKENVPLSPAAETPRPTTSQMRQTSTKFNILDWGRHIIGWVTGTTAGVKTLDAMSITSTKTFVDSVYGFINDYGVFMLLLSLALAFTVTCILMKKMKDDVEDDRYIPSGEK